MSEPFKFEPVQRNEKTRIKTVSNLKTCLWMESPNYIPDSLCYTFRLKIMRRRVCHYLPMTTYYRHE